MALISYDEFTVRHEMRFWIADYVDLPKIRDSFVSRVWYVAKRHGLTFPTRAHEIMMLEPEVQNRVDLQVQIIEMLRLSPLLGWLNNDLLENIAEHSLVQPYGKGEVIIRQGEISNDCFLLYSGQAREYYRSLQGQIHALNHLKPGNMFGIVSLVRDCGDETSVSAEQDSEVLVISEQAMLKVLEQHPELSVTVEQFIDSKMRELNALDQAEAASDEPKSMTVTK
ncbi:MAG: cyclic nucleotide-binding domain-containing protein [Thiolinea sp.]